ncbi:unnamed protein product [Spirodela intermedia]|uniref:Cupin type-1 domain-containing protein n=1 Tax=Spirodela intermedia TaxID=51605 RepID=A0A7I8IWV5_SPIIN|nr:unnamed protein product [Spirodela intermedia]CAA6662475.1 unnamed protein product [Spirodela intermedia]
MARCSPFLLHLFLAALIAADTAVGYGTSEQRRSDARQCRMQHISTTRPCCSFKSEGGITELWDENEDQFQCAGVSAMRATIQSESMTLPNYSPSPRLVYIQKGQGLMGISYPGCPETFHSAGGLLQARGRVREGEPEGPASEDPQDSAGSQGRVEDDQAHRYGGEAREGSRDGPNPNGMEEIYCNMRIHQYLDNPREADVYSRQAGRLYSVNMHKLPILRYIGMSAERGNLKSNVLFGPHWTINAHTVVYITRGEGRTQIVSNEGRTLFDENVKMGDVFVIPQYFASMHKVGDNGVEWVAFKTSPVPMRSPIVGHASVFKGCQSG